MKQTFKNIFILLTISNKQTTCLRQRLQELCKIKKSIFWLTDFLSLHVEVYSFAYIISFKPNRFFGRWSVAVSLNVSHSPKISFSKAVCCSSFFSKHFKLFSPLSLANCVMEEMVVNKVTIWGRKLGTGWGLVVFQKMVQVVDIFCVLPVFKSSGRFSSAIFFSLFFSPFFE